jgi:hypothetical protein
LKSNKKIIVLDLVRGGPEISPLILPEPTILRVALVPKISRANVEDASSPPFLYNTALCICGCDDDELKVSDACMLRKPDKKKPDSFIFIFSIFSSRKKNHKQYDNNKKMDAPGGGDEKGKGRADESDEFKLAVRPSDLDRPDRDPIDRASEDRIGIDEAEEEEEGDVPLMVEEMHRAAGEGDLVRLRQIMDDLRSGVYDDCHKVRVISKNCARVLVRSKITLIIGKGTQEAHRPLLTVSKNRYKFCYIITMQYNI